MTGDQFNAYLNQKFAEEGGYPPGAVTAEARERIELRRMGNICECARAAGWRARLAQSIRGGYCLQWLGPQGEVVSPGWERTAERALYVGCGMVEGKI
jgi:hypothetical protein